jgi:hypothetical protein
MSVTVTAEIIPYPGLNAEPAYLEQTAAGLVVHAIYCWEGERHRIEGPAVIKHDRKTGVCTLEEYWLWGKFQRAIERDAKTGKVKCVQPPPRSPSP